MYEPIEHKRNKLFTYWIEIVGTCNLRCPTCPQGNFLDNELSVGRNPTGFMELTLYKQILEKIKADNISDRIEIKSVSNELIFRCKGTFAQAEVRRAESDGSTDFIQQDTHKML